MGQIYRPLLYKYFNTRELFKLVTMWDNNSKQWEKFLVLFNPWKPLKTPIIVSLTQLTFQKNGVILKV